MSLSLGISFITGILTFFSPCILPILPVYFSILAGSSSEDHKKVSLLINTVFFILGFSVIFILLGVSISTLSQLLLFNKQIIVKIAGIFVMFFGLFLMGIIKIPQLMQEKRKQVQFKKITPITAFLLGSAFSLGWTPCIGPVLSSMLIMAGNASSLKIGLLFLIVFTLGFALPFLILAFFADKASSFVRLSGKYLPIMQKLSGAILVVMGVMLYMDLL